jgi:two-component system cell cycle sensor histidine kinase/response regulator CckA
MTSDGVSTVVTGLLQLSVPSYAFRLVRRFGTQRVGWFIVMAFVSLAFLHLAGPWRVPGRGAGSILITDISYAVGSMLLLVGMGHVETMFRERDKARSHEVALRDAWDSHAKEETAHLIKVNKELQQAIAQRDEITEEVRHSEARYRQLFENNPQPMWILDLRDGRFLVVNLAAMRQYGFTAEEFAGLTGRDLLLPTCAAEFVQDLGRACPNVESRGVWQHCKKDGTLIDVDVTAVDMDFGGRTARLVVAQDITQRRKRELRQQQAHKMETVGQVAGGIAHHFNNVLAIIEAHTSALLERPVDLKSAEELEHISAATSRAAALTRQLLMAGSRHMMKLEQIDLNALIRNLNPLLSRLVGEQILLENHFSFLPAVLADRRLIEHILVHLVLNAREAMPNGGTLTVSTTRIHIDESQVESGHPDRAGDFVRLSIRDTGCGIPPESRPRVFEPFFTTREAGRGAGLGLASVYGAARQLSGWVEYTTEVDVGTEFRIFVPCAPATTGTAQTEPGSSTDAKATVLLVETDDRVRALARFVLNRHGYHVIEADGAATALVLWQGQGANVDLLLVDPSLPGDLSGCGLVVQFKQLKPGLKVLYTPAEKSGRVGSAELAATDGVTSITKPYSPDTLLQAVTATLKA